jgi:hypothetical protein
MNRITLRKATGLILLMAGAWALIAPQANLGLTELRWMARNTFPGEALVGIALLVVSQFLLGRMPKGNTSEARSLRKRLDS